MGKNEEVEMRRVLITGSRDWEDATVIFEHLDMIMRKWGTNLTIVHGGARGADTLAGAWAKLQGVVEEVHPADWDKYGKRAGFVRNAEMVNLGANICLAFIKNNSKGATMAAELATRKGIVTVVVRG